MKNIILKIRCDTPQSRNKKIIPSYINKKNNLVSWTTLPNSIQDFLPKFKKFLEIRNLQARKIILLHGQLCKV